MYEFHYIFKKLPVPLHSTNTNVFNFTQIFTEKLYNIGNNTIYIFSLDIFNFFCTLLEHFKIILRTLTHDKQTKLCITFNTFFSTRATMLTVQRYLQNWCSTYVVFGTIIILLCVKYYIINFFFGNINTFYYFYCKKIIVLNLIKYYMFNHRWFNFNHRWLTEPYFFFTNSNWYINTLKKLLKLSNSKYSKYSKIKTLFFFYYNPKIF